MNATAEIEPYVPGFFDKYINYSEKSYKLSRKEFLVGFLIVYAFSKIPLTSMFAALNNADESFKFLVILILIGKLLFTCYIYTLLIVKRLYDADINYWLTIEIVIPLVNFIVFGVCFFKSTKNKNKNFPNATRNHIFIITLITIGGGLVWVPFFI